MAKEYCIVWTYHIFFACSSVDEHLGCFHFLIIMNSGAVNICVQASVWTYAFISLGYIPRSKTAGCGRHQSGSLSREKIWGLTEEWANFVLEEDI